MNPFDKPQQNNTYGGSTPVKGSSSNPFDKGSQAPTKTHSMALVPDMWENKEVATTKPRQVATGVAKSALRMIPNTISGLTDVAGFLAGNSFDSSIYGKTILNKDSERGQAFDAATKGNTGAEKLGATATDIASLFVPVGGQAKAVSLATKAVPVLGRLASKAGTAGKIARFATKAPGLFAEGAIGTSILNKGEVGGKDVGMDVAGMFAGPLLGKAVGAGADIYKRATMGAEGFAASKADDLFNTIKQQAGSEGLDPIRAGELAQNKADFVDKVKSIVTKKSQEAAIARGDAKIQAYEPDSSVLDFLYDKIGTLGKSVDGKIDSSDVVKYLEDNVIPPISNKVEELFRASGDTVVFPTRIIDKNGKEVLSNTFLDDLKSSMLSGVSETGRRNDIDRLIDKLAKDYFIDNTSGNLIAKTPAELYEASKAIRKKIYAMTRDPQQFSDVGIMRDIMRAYDDKLRKTVPGATDGAFDEAFKEMTKYYDAMDVLGQLNGAKIPGAIGNFAAKALGTITGGIVGGPGVGGFIGTQAGYAIGPRLNKLFGESAFNSKLNSQTQSYLSKLFTQDNVQQIIKNLDNEIVSAKNFSEFVTAERNRKAFLEKLKKDITSSIKKRDFQASKNAQESVKINKERILINNFLNGLIEQSKISKAKESWSNLQKLKDLYEGKGSPLALPAGTKNEFTMPNPEAIQLPDSTTSEKIKNRLIDYIGR